ncbi:ABC transporter permease [Corallincola holothuriorum]|uniref:ABC transporter permease n=1 Tax=Corallincola holothuriorum TaxID=2282215 RepID=A0A368NNS2_9GAMM|nr:ABC transporter permease [Corallincola holothuriorum]
MTSITAVFLITVLCDINNLIRFEFCRNSGSAADSRTLRRAFQGESDVHELNIRRTDDGTGWLLELTGDWVLRRGDHRVDDLLQALKSKVTPDETLIFVDADIGRWNSALVVLIRRVSEYAKAHRLHVDVSRLPQGAQQLLALAESQSNAANRPNQTTYQPTFAERIGNSVLASWENILVSFSFIGALISAVGKLCVGKAEIRAKDVYDCMHDAGPAAFGIVALISILIGMILAFVGAVQLQQFGASIFVASLVALGMAREMGAMMTAIIMAGRTGASYAAQLGSMQVNEEIDALTTMGLRPIEFLVLPRFIALLIMLPLLTVFSMALGILGGALVSQLMLDISFTQFVEQMTTTVPLRHFAIGLLKSVLFALVIAVAGCMNGINCGRNAMAVGQATTRSVVSAIVFIIVVDAIVTITTTLIGI